MSNTVVLRSYWPAWVGWTVGVAAVAGPLLLSAGLRLDMALALAIGAAPWWFAMMLFAPYADEHDPETRSLKPRTREGWRRAWRRAIIWLAVLVPVCAALYGGIQRLNLS